MKPKILATSWHPGGIKAIIPVIKQAKKDSLVDIITIGHEFSEPFLKQAGIDYKTIQDYSLQDVSQESMQKLLQQTNPNLVLTGTSTQENQEEELIEQTITLATKQAQIASLSVLDVWMSYWQRFSNIYEGEKGKFKFLPTKIAIMDKYAKQEMLSQDFPKDILVITGNPHFDNLEQKAKSFTPEKQNQILEQTRLNKGTFIFYVGSVWEKIKDDYGYWDLDNIQLINESIKALPQKHRKRTGLITKLHPRTPKQDIEKISQYIKEKGEGRISLVTDIHPHDLILASDLTLTAISTTAIEAVYMHKPSISIQPGLKCQDDLKIVTNNHIISVGYTTEDCQHLVKRAITDPNYRQKLIEQSSKFTTDGKATQRVTDLAYKMAGL